MLCDTTLKMVKTAAGTTTGHDDERLVMQVIICLLMRSAQVMTDQLTGMVNSSFKAASHTQFVSSAS